MPTRIAQVLKATSNPGIEPRRPKRRYTLYTSLLAVGMVLFLYLVLGIWPFGNASLLTGDMNGLYISFFSHFKRAVLGQGDFAYSFSMGLGGGTLGLFATYAASPFNLLYVLFPTGAYPAVTSVLFLIKVTLASVFFRVYISAKYPKLGWRSVALSLCYGFMAYSIAYAQNIMWHDSILLLPLICLAVDRLIAGRSFLPYTLALALCIFSNYYTAYMVCIFVVIYFIFSMLTRTPEQKEAGGKKAVLRFLGGSLLAGGLCAALLLPALAAAGQSKDVASFSFSLATNFPLVRLPERFLWGSFVFSDVSNTLPFVFCGMLIPLLVLCYFIARNVPVREKLLSGGVIVLFLLSFWLKGPDQIWHMLQSPVWFPARYSFTFCFFLIFLAARAMQYRAAGGRQLLVSAGILALALVVMAIFPIAISRSRILMCLVAVVTYAFLSTMAASSTDGSRGRRRVISGLVALLVAGEMALNAYILTRQFELYPISGYQDFVAEAGGTVLAIQQADADAWRLAENHYRTLNDPMLLGYWGTSHFSSTHSGIATRLMYNLGYRNHSATGPYLRGGTAFADAVLSLRYLSDGGESYVPLHWEPSDIEAPDAVWQNPYALPMLFTFGGSAPAGEGEEVVDMFAYQNGLYHRLAEGAQGLPEDMLQPVESAVLRAEDGAALPLGGPVPPGAQYEITAERDGWHYAYFDADYLVLAMAVNGEYTEPYFTLVNSGVIELGYLNKGDVATVSWDQTADAAIRGAYFASIAPDDMQLFSNWAAEGAGEFVVRDGRVDGTVTAKDGRTMLYTSIPYDAAWTATVNGRSVQPQALMGDLLCLPLDEGENVVSLRYVPALSGLGLALTILSLLLLVAAVILGQFFRHRQRMRFVGVEPPERISADAASPDASAGAAGPPPEPAAGEPSGVPPSQTGPEIPDPNPETDKTTQAEE